MQSHNCILQGDLIFQSVSDCAIFIELCMNIAVEIALAGAVFHVKANNEAVLSQFVIQPKNSSSTYLALAARTQISQSIFTDM